MFFEELWFEYDWKIVMKPFIKWIINSPFILIAEPDGCWLTKLFNLKFMINELKLMRWFTTLFNTVWFLDNYIHFRYLRCLLSWNYEKYSCCSDLLSLLWSHIHIHTYRYDFIRWKIKLLYKFESVVENHELVTVRTRSF